MQKFRLTMTLETERNHSQDIRTFIESQLRFEQDADAELIREIRAEILEKSSGIFLWVNLVVHQLNVVQRQDGRMKAVQRRLREIPEAAKQQPVPNGSMPLYGLYQDIIHKDEKNIDKLVQFTQIVFCARQPLHPKELYVLLHQAYDAPFDSNEAPDHFLAKYVLEVSKGLAEVTKSVEPTVQFIHETVRDFLSDGGLKSISTHSVNRDGHETLKSSCLEQIHAPVSQHLELLADYRLRGRYWDTQVDEVTRPLQKESKEQANDMFPFLEYASKNILFHAEEARAMGASQSEFLESFPLAEWIPIHNLFEKFNTRRYSGTSTPLLYILAQHGCDRLIQSLSESRSQFLPGQYFREVKGNAFSSALACAIYNGHLDTAWTLAGLDPKGRPPDTVVPPKTEHSAGQSSLIRMLQKLGDVPLMRKVLQDQRAMRQSMRIAFEFELFNSAEMIDMFLEVGFKILVGETVVECHYKQVQADQGVPEASRPNADLIFIRRAIEKDPSLLGSRLWGGATMLDFAVRKDLQSLVTLYMEYSDGHQSDVDAVLHCAAAAGQLSMVTFAHLRGANLGSQDGNGRTALHLAVRHFNDLGEHAKILKYLLSEEPSCVNVRDYEGQTALAIAASWVSGTPSQGSHVRFFETFLQAFLQAGADTNIVRRCHVWECQKHNVPLLVFLALRGDIRSLRLMASHHQCDLNTRDSYGRTALSWMFSYRYMGRSYGIHHMEKWAIGEYLLQQPAVNVNSRDNSGNTVLEHFIRHPFPSIHEDRPTFKSFVRKFFSTNFLDTNLPTSNGQFPLELIVSLYGTWPKKFGDLAPDRHMVPDYFVPPPYANSRIQKDFNQHLIETAELLLGTGKVDIDVQLRCAEQAAPELKSIILGSMESTS